MFGFKTNETKKIDIERRNKKKNRFILNKLFRFVTLNLFKYLNFLI